VRLDRFPRRIALRGPTASETLIRQGLDAPPCRRTPVMNRVLPRVGSMPWWFRSNASGHPTGAARDWPCFVTPTLLGSFSAGYDHFDYGLMASAQNASSASTKCASVKPAAVSISGSPLFDCPE
jgi:hypothetical protein